MYKNEFKKSVAYRTQVSKISYVDQWVSWSLFQVGFMKFEVCKTTLPSVFTIERVFNFQS